MPDLLNFLREGQECSEQNARVFPYTYEDGVGGWPGTNHKHVSRTMQTAGRYKVKVLAVGGNRFS